MKMIKSQRSLLKFMLIPILIILGLIVILFINLTLTSTSTTSDKNTTLNASTTSKTNKIAENIYTLTDLKKPIEVPISDSTDIYLIRIGYDYDHKLKFSALFNKDNPIKYSIEFMKKIELKNLFDTDGKLISEMKLYYLYNPQNEEFRFKFTDNKLFTKIVKYKINKDGTTNLLNNSYKGSIEEIYQ